MSRTRFLVALAVSALLCAAASASASTTSPPLDQLRSLVCQKALDPPARAISIQAVMRPVTGTAKMQMRFDLMRKTPRSGGLVIVRGRLLGSWITQQNPPGGQPSGQRGTNEPGLLPARDAGGPARPVSDRRLLDGRAGHVHGGPRQ